MSEYGALARRSRSRGYDLSLKLGDQLIAQNERVEIPEKARLEF